MFGKSTCLHGIEYDGLSNPARSCFQCAMQEQVRRQKNVNSFAIKSVEFEHDGEKFICKINKERESSI